MRSTSALACCEVSTKGCACLGCSMPICCARYEKTGNSNSDGSETVTTPFHVSITLTWIAAGRIPQVRSAIFFSARQIDNELTVIRALPIRPSGKGRNVPLSARRSDERHQNVWNGKPRMPTSLKRLVVLNISEHHTSWAAEGKKQKAAAARIATTTFTPSAPSSAR
jgi:hypothetical protein